MLNFQDNSFLWHFCLRISWRLSTGSWRSERLMLMVVSLVCFSEIVILFPKKNVDFTKFFVDLVISVLQSFW